MKMKKNKVKTVQKVPIQAYKITNSDDNTAEINLYGDVYEEIPRDWNGNPIEGQFISSEQFLQDLEDLKDKNRITIHINSGGGALYAGLAIYNRLKALNAEIITINDGIAGSAASLIFEAGDIRQMNAASNLMAHGASTFLFGRYDTESLETLLMQFKAHDKAVYSVYAERMGTSLEEAEQFVKGETWLTGAEAVEKGLADEVIGEEEDEDSENDIGLQFIKAQMRPFMPSNLSFVPMNQAQEVKEIKEEDEPMIENVKDLKAQYPDLIKEIEDTATEHGMLLERARIREIEEIETTISDKSLLNKAKYEEPMTISQLAVAVVKAQAAAGEELIGKMEQDAKASCVNQVTAAPTTEHLGADAPENKEAKEAEMQQYIEAAKSLR